MVDDRRLGGDNDSLSSRRRFYVSSLSSSLPASVSVLTPPAGLVIVVAVATEKHIIRKQATRVVVILSFISGE